MATSPDEFEAERSRAAVTVACLEWLRCTGPTLEAQPVRVKPTAAVNPYRDVATNLSPGPNIDPPHPLWDRWIDG